MCSDFWNIWFFWGIFLFVIKFSQFILLFDTLLRVLIFSNFLNLFLWTFFGKIVQLLLLILHRNLNLLQYYFSFHVLSLVYLFLMLRANRFFTAWAGGQFSSTRIDIDTIIVDTTLCHFWNILMMMPMLLYQTEKVHFFVKPILSFFHQSL